MRTRSEETRKKISLAKKKFYAKKFKEDDTNPSYSSVHKWLSKNFLKSRCAHCRSKLFLEWALKKKSVHAHRRSHYLILCSSCHKKYDYTSDRKKKLSSSLKKVVHTKEWNKKISHSLIGKKMSDSTKKKLSEWHKKNPYKRDPKTGRFYGKR